MKLTKENAVFFDINTLGPFGEDISLTCLGAIHCSSGQVFERFVTRQTSEEDVIILFLDWLGGVNGGEPVNLIAFNAFGFDMKVLQTVARRYKIKLFKEIINGFYDAMHGYKCFLNLPNFRSLDYIAGNKEPRENHGAKNDSKVLRSASLKTLRQKGIDISDLYTKKSFKNNQTRKMA